MHTLRTLRHKTKVGLTLCLLLLLLLIKNIAGQETNSRMQQYARSIYEDRLMPSTYLYGIREQLDAARVEHAGNGTLKKDNDKIAGHWTAITGLMARYEQTVLTAQERREWNTFRKELLQVHQLFLTSREGEAHYKAIFSSLDHLIAIQAVEGAHLNHDLAAALSGSSLMAYLEIALLVIAASATVVLVGSPGSAADRPVLHRPSLN